MKEQLDFIDNSVYENIDFVRNFGAGLGLFVVTHPQSKLFGCVVSVTRVIDLTKAEVTPAHSGVGALLRPRATINFRNLTVVKDKDLVISAENAGSVDLLQGYSEKWMITNSQSVLKVKAIGPVSSAVNVLFGDEELRGMLLSNKHLTVLRFKSVDHLLPAPPKKQGKKTVKPKTIVGKKVKISKKSKFYLENNPTNPIDLDGEVISEKKSNLGVRVRWSNGCVNAYGKEDLELLG